MKKKLLFVMPSLTSGGGEKSLINLLLQIDYEVYEVDLFLFNKSGLFLNLIPKEVNIIEIPYDNKIFTRFIIKSIKQFLKEGKMLLVYSRFIFSLFNIISKTNKEQKTWRYVSNSFVQLKKEYDIAIGFLEKSPIYFIVDKVIAKKKIGWIHTNYGNSDMDYRFDASYFNKLDYLVTVSNECAHSLMTTFPDLKDRIKIIENIVSPQTVEELSHKGGNDFSTQDNNYIKLITVARLSYEKGIDLAINACKLLVNQGYQISWQIIGEGTERENLERLIKRNGLTNTFILLGTKANPYPYIKNADIYVQSSRYEGKSIAIDEAKILHKPIVVTNYPTVKDQISDKKNGLIVNQDPNSICAGIATLIHDKRLKCNIISNLSKENLSTEKEIEKFYALIEDVSNA